MTQRPFDIVVALDLNNGIGHQNTIPWRLPADMRYFRMITSATHSPEKQNAVLMGRNTWTSLPDRFKPLPNRKNIVLSRAAQLPLPENVSLCRSLDDALSMLQNRNEIENIFCIGGAELYKTAIHDPACRYLYITRIFETYPCDRFFPDYESQFKEVESSEVQIENNIRFQFKTYRKK